MRSGEYRDIIRAITNSVVRVNAPGLKGKYREIIANEISKRIHARLYGANVDGVESPLYRDIYPDRMPTFTSVELLDQLNTTEEK